MKGKDILQEIPDENLFKLRDLYKEHQDWAPHVYSMFNTCIRWRKTAFDKNYQTFYGVGDDYLKTGTFVLHQQYNCYHFFVCTLEESPENLRKALLETEKFDFTKTLLFYASINRFTQTIRDVLDSRGVKYKAGETGLYHLSKENALKFVITLPEDVYLDKVTEAHVDQINQVWPHRYEGSEGYLRTFVTMNAGFGIFLKEDGKLVAWILKNFLGQLGILQTKEGYKRKGYASILIQALAMEIAEDGHNAIGTVMKGNTASEMLFTKLGFVNIDACSYINANL